MAAFIGDVVYQFLLKLNRPVNSWRRRLGPGYWSLSAYVKSRVKNAVSFIGEFEKAIVRYAGQFKVAGVVCGHIHHAAIREVQGIMYYNCGDFVESCTALVEHHDGRIKPLTHLARQADTTSFGEPSEDLLLPETRCRPVELCRAYRQWRAARCSNGALSLRL